MYHLTADTGFDRTLFYLNALGGHLLWALSREGKTFDFFSSNYGQTAWSLFFLCYGEWRVVASAAEAWDHDWLGAFLVTPKLYSCRALHVSGLVLKHHWVIFDCRHHMSRGLWQPAPVVITTPNAKHNKFAGNLLCTRLCNILQFLKVFEMCLCF